MAAIQTTLSFTNVRTTSDPVILRGYDRENVIEIIKRHHYSHSVPSGKTHWVGYGDAIVGWSIPANNNVSNFLIGKENAVWELSRLWAPDGHEKNLLTKTISRAVKILRSLEPSVDAVVSYADPNVGHAGTVYRAASWHFCGQCQETRYYVDGTGQVVARRKFHSGNKGLTKTEIEALGFRQTSQAGKYRFALGLRKWAKREIRQRF